MDDNVDTKKYEVTRESKSGRLKSFNVIAGVATLTVALAFGHIVVTNIDEYFTRKQYSYDSNYDSYSEQIETMMNIDLDNSLEDNLNSMEEMRESIENYQDNDGMMIKTDALKVLLENKTNFENSALDIAKKWCANEWGGKAEDYNIVSDSSSSDWIAVNQSNGSNTSLSGDVYDLVSAIGSLQGYSEENIRSMKGSDDFVDTCDSVAKISGVVATSIETSKSK